MKNRKPQILNREIILPSTLLGSFLGAVIGLYTLPRIIPQFSLFGGIAGGSSATFLLLNKREEIVIEGRKVLKPSTKQNLFNSLLLGGSHQSSKNNLKLGKVSLPSEAETGNIFIIGRPGSGKSQAIFQLLESLRNRLDVRVVIIDRGGEFIERLHQLNDLIFNPFDERSIGWCHTHERQYLDFQALATSFLPIPEKGENTIWYDSAQLLLATIWETCLSNSEVNQILKSNLSQIAQWVQGTRASQCFDDPRLASSVLFTLTPNTRCYDYLPDLGEPLSFFGYGKGDDPRWLFFPLIEEQTDLIKTPVSAAIDLVIRGVLSKNENSSLKTIVVIDELGALQKLPSLRRFLSEGRKHGGCAILGTQTEAQIIEIYGQEETRILLQNTRTKLILNCPDPNTAKLMAETIGQHKVWQQRSIQKQLKVIEDCNWEITEKYVVPPYKLQMLPDLNGYVLLGDNSPIIKTIIPLSNLKATTPKFKSRLPK